MATLKHSFPTAATPSGISVLINPSLARPPAPNNGVSNPQSLTKSGIASIEPKITIPGRSTQFKRTDNNITPVLQSSSVSSSSKATVCDSLQRQLQPSTKCNSIQHARGKTTLASQPSAITVPGFEKNNETCKSCSEIYSSLGLNESPPPQLIQARKPTGFMFPLPRGPAQGKSATNIPNLTLTPVSKSVTWPRTKSVVSKSAPANMEGLVKNISTPKKIQHVKHKSPHPNFPPSSVPISAPQTTCQVSSSISSTFPSVSTSSVLTPTPGRVVTGMSNILNPAQKTVPPPLPQLQQLVHTNKAIVSMNCNSFPPLMSQSKNALPAFQSAPTSITPSLKLTTAAVAKPPSFGGTSPAKLVRCSRCNIMLIPPVNAMYYACPCGQTIRSQFSPTIPPTSKHASAKTPPFKATKSFSPFTGRPPQPSTLAMPPPLPKPRPNPIINMGKSRSPRGPGPKPLLTAKKPRKAMPPPTSMAPSPIPKMGVHPQPMPTLPTTQQMSTGQVPHYMSISPPNLTMMAHQSVPKAPGFAMEKPALDESNSGKKTATTDSAKKKPPKKAKKSAASKGGKQGSKSSAPPKLAGEPKTITKPGQMRMRLRNTKTGHIVGGFAAPMRKHLHKYLSTHPHMRQLLPHEMAASNASGHGRRAGCCCCCGAETARRTAPAKSKANSKAKQTEEKANSSAAKVKVKVEKPVAPKVKPEPPIWKENTMEKISPAAPEEKPNVFLGNAGEDNPINLGPDLNSFVDDLALFGTDQTDTSEDTNLGGAPDNIDAAMLDEFSMDKDMSFDPSTFFGGMDKPDEGNWKPPPLPMMMPWLPDCESSDIDTKEPAVQQNNISDIFSEPTDFSSPRKQEESRADLALFDSPATSKSHSLFTIAPSPTKSNTTTSTSMRTICSPGKVIPPAVTENTWRTEPLCAELKRLLEWLARESYIPTRELYHLESRQSPSKPSQFPPTTVSASVPSPALGAPPPLCHVLTLAANGTPLQKSNPAPMKRPLANATGSGVKMNPLKRVKLEPNSVVPGMPAQSPHTPTKPTAKLTWPFTEQHPEWVPMLRKCLKRSQTDDASSGADFVPKSSNQSFDMFSSDESEREWLLEEGYVRGESLTWRLIYKRQQDDRMKQAKKSKPASSKAKSKEPGKKNNSGKADEATEGFDGWLECCAMLNDLKQHISYLHPPGQGVLDEPSDQTFTFEYLQNQLELEGNAEQESGKTPKPMSTQCNLKWTLTCAPFLGDELLRFANTSKDGKPDASDAKLLSLRIINEKLLRATTPPPVDKEKDTSSGKGVKGKTGQPKKGRPKGSKTATKESPKIRTRSWLTTSADTSTTSTPIQTSSRTRSTSAAATTRDTPPVLPAYTSVREFVKDMRKLFHQWSNFRKGKNVAIEVELGRAVLQELFEAQVASLAILRPCFAEFSRKRGRPSKKKTLGDKESGVIHTAFVERTKRTVVFQQDEETHDMELWVQNKRVPKLDGSRIVYTTRRKKTSKKGKKGRKATPAPSLPPLAVMDSTASSGLSQVYCIRSTGPPNRRPLRDLALPVKGKQNSKATLGSPDVCPLCFTVKNIKEIRKEQQIKRQDLLNKQNSKRSNRVKKKTPVSQKSGRKGKSVARDSDSLLADAPPSKSSSLLRIRIRSSSESNGIRGPVIISDDPESDLGLLDFAEDISKRIIDPKDSEGEGKDDQDKDTRENRKNESTESESKEKSRENPLMPLHNYTLTAGPTARPHRRCALAGCNCLCSCGCSCDVEKNDAEARQPESKSSSSAKTPISSRLFDNSDSKDSSEQDAKTYEHDVTENDEADDYAMLLSWPDSNFEATSLPCSRHWDGAQLAFANVASRWLTINPDY